MLRRTVASNGRPCGTTKKRRAGRIFATGSVGSSSYQISVPVAGGGSKLDRMETNRDSSHQSGSEISSKGGNFKTTLCNRFHTSTIRDLVTAQFLLGRVY